VLEGICSVRDTQSVLNLINYILAATAKTESGDILDKHRIKHTPLTKDELTELLRTDYSSAYKKFLENKIMFRGVNDSTKYFIGRYGLLKPGLRISQYARYNLYTRLFSDILPSWKGYPPRNRSFICTSSTGKALEFTDTFPALDEWKNNVYAVLPKNGAVIGVCPKSDLWFAFPTIKKLNFKNTKFKYLKDFQDVFMEFIRFISLILYDLTAEDTGKDTLKDNIWKILNNALEYGSNTTIVAIFNTLSNYLSNHVDNIINIISENNSVLRKHGFEAVDKHNALIFLSELKRYNTTDLLEYLDIILNAKANGFKKVKIENYNIKSVVSRDVRETGQEVWTDSECLFVNRLFLEKL